MDYTGAGPSSTEKQNLYQIFFLFPKTDFLKKYQIFQKLEAKKLVRSNCSCCPAQHQPPRHVCRHLLEEVRSYVGVPHAGDHLLQLLDVLGGHQLQLVFHVGLHFLNLTLQCILTFYSILSSFFFPMSVVERFFQTATESKLIIFSMQAIPLRACFIDGNPTSIGSMPGLLPTRRPLSLQGQKEGGLERPLQTFRAAQDLSRRLYIFLL